LAVSGASDYTPRIAETLRRTSYWLPHLERLEEARAATQEAVMIRRRLAREDPARHEAELAKELYNYAVDLAAVGQKEEAVAAGQEAVAIYQRLTDPDDPDTDADAHDVAHAMHNLGGHLADLERYDEARKTAGQAVIWRLMIMTQTDPESLAHALAEGLLADSLASFSRVLASLEDWEGARATADNALEIYDRYGANSFEPGVEMARAARTTALEGLDRSSRPERH
jgi:tetratricopeptide (TPR) repeat protein